jgi:hypothetical protein
MKRLWGRPRHTPDDHSLDEWARRRLQVRVPQASFERVWSAAASSMHGVRGRPPWELELTVRRLQVWTRVLAGGLAVVSVLLLMALARATEDGTDSASSGRQHELAVMTETHSLLPPTEAAAHRRYDLLADPRIVLGRVIE